MRWPWRDLLFLHGHIVDDRPSNLPEEKPLATREKEPMTTALLKQRGLAALRLCLGIGDGAVRTQ